ncbi:MAG: 1-acyl-sn-glycerol-3-phosphate acyltransferase [Fluviicola sp.]|jgi:1-acyl-sn-glycerol-3-phosphate acyltransferase|nr:1-acyl-sn-glycerol-3-phosphate acyltransferase [Fluviicola sp.]MBP6271557.1 1-acyl-sn-glycerol-3-phosphate acyltransferase [Fluviicola sp.]
MGKIFYWILRMFGWKIDPLPKDFRKKAVVVVGPHTSNWDFVVGKMTFVYYGINAKFLIKKELFFPPLGWLLKRMGGIPVDRARRANVTKQVVDYFNSSDECIVVFTPEGTRSYQPNWKKGFYYIAQNAQVPIYISYIDFKNKTGGFLSLMEPSGDVEQDLLTIKRAIFPFKGKFPENGIREEEIK